jgi:uncharacterized membrane protein
MSSAQNNSGKEAEMSYGRIGLMISKHVTAIIGSWAFIIFQSCVVFAGILFNAYHLHEFAPHSFIVLNIILSLQATCVGSIVLMTINHQANLDKRRDVEILRLQKKIHEVILMLDAHDAHINLIEMAKTAKSSKV